MGSIDKTYSLALSGGGVRGFAHVGVSKALAEMGVTFSAISGASSGALVGAFLCDGFSPDEIAEIITREEPMVGINFRGLRHGLLSFSAVEKVLRKHLRSTRFEQLRKPLFVSATDLRDGCQKVFSEGEIVPVLCASSALPLLLPPARVNGVPYGDAGMSNNLPVEPLCGRGEKIIGVHVNPVQPYREGAGFIETIDRSMHIIVGNNIRAAASLCDIFIEPPGLMRYHLLQTRKAGEIMEVGYSHVKATLRREDLCG